MAYRRHLDQRVPLTGIGTAEAGTSSDAEYGSAARFRPHPPIFAPDLLLVAGGVVHLGIQVVAAQDWPAGRKIVVRERIRSNLVGRRVVALNFLCDRIDAIGRNDIAGKRGPAGAVGGARVGVVDHRRNRAEIAGLEGVGRDRVVAGPSLALPRAVEAQEVEQLVLLDGAADGGAEIVIDGQRLIGSGGLEERARVEVLVVVELKSTAVDLVAPVLGPPGARRRARHSLL